MTLDFNIEHSGNEFGAELDIGRITRQPKKGIKYGRSEGERHIIRVLEIWVFFFYIDITLIRKKNDYITR